MPSVNASIGAKAQVAAEEEKATVVPQVERARAATYSAAESAGGVHSAIVGLLRELPAPGMPWSSNKKQRFLAAFQSTIDFIYPEDES
jgi:hypothetical protein